MKVNKAEQWMLIARWSFQTTLLTTAFIFATSMPAASADLGACKRVVLSGDSNYPPFSWYENKVFHGSAIEITALALDRIHLPYDIRYVGAFPQMLEGAKTGKVDVIAELKHTPERQVYLSYSTVPIFTNPVALFTRSEQKFAFGSWNDLAGLHGVITVGNKFGGGFDEFMALRLNVESADNIGLSFAKLSSGRSDYFVNSYYPAISYLIREHKETDFKVLQPFVTTTENFAAWSKVSPCIGKRAEFDAALTAMVQSGEVRRILDTNLDRLRHNQPPK